MGKIHGHPRFMDGAKVITPPIVEAERPMVIVEGGSWDDKERYEVVLGEVEPGFREWLREHRPSWDPENPIKFLKN
jgi:hypothetical protein